MAHKRRHLMLLQKVRESKALSPAEIKELEKYETMAKKQQRTAEIITTPVVDVTQIAKKTASKVKKTTKKVSKNTKKNTKKDKSAATKSTQKKRSTSKSAKKQAQRLPINAAEIKKLAFENETLTQAAALIPEVNLLEVLGKYSTLEKAWQRGAFLKSLADLATSAATHIETEETLGLGFGELENLIATDKEIADVWKRSRIKTVVALKRSIVNGVLEGNLASARQLEAILKRELATTAIDMTRLTILQMTELVDRPRQTLHEWHTKYGLPRNSDKTFSLAVFLKWFEEFTIKKVNIKPIETDSLKDEKAKQLRMRTEEMKGNLLDRNEVIVGLIARDRALLDAFSKQVDNLPEIMGNQPPQEIKMLLEKVFEEIRRDLALPITQLKLPEAQEIKLRQLLDELKSEDEKNENLKGGENQIND